MNPVDGSEATSRTRLLTALAIALCLIAGSRPRIIGDGGEYLAQALNFAEFNRPSIGRQTIPSLERRLGTIDPALAGWNLADSAPAGADQRRDFVHFWFYALAASPFVWLADRAGASPLHGFTLLNVLLIAIALGLAFRRLPLPVVVLLFASPVIWWIDKAHTEMFTVSLITIAILTMRERPGWAMVAAGAAATQNPPIAVLLPLIAGVTLFERGRAALANRGLVAGATVGFGLAVLQPAYTYARHGTASLLIDMTRPGLPGTAELTAAVLDPSMGLAGNFPVFLIGTLAALTWLAARNWRHLLSPPIGVAAVTAVAFLYAFAQTGNSHHGGTPSLTRYALWLIPLAIPVWSAWWAATGPRAHRSLAAAAAVSAVLSVFAFHPAVAERSREPTWLASWLWTTHPGWNNPLPEVFSETMLGAEGTTVPAATAGCEKVLLGSSAPGEPVWPIPCLPAPLPAACATSGTLCYANRRGADYDFAVAPGRLALVYRQNDSAWPAAAEPHMRRILLEAGWADLVAKGRDIAVLRANHDVRVAAFGADDRFLLVLRQSGPNPSLQLRSARPLRGTLFDATTGAALMPLAFDGTGDELWTLPLPAVDDDLLLMTMHQLPATTAP